MLDARLYLPEEWASDAARGKKIPDDVVFPTKPQIALDLIDRAKANGIEVVAWTADEAYVVEIPPNAHVWILKPKVLKTPPDNATGRPKKHPRLRSHERQPSEPAATLHSILKRQNHALAQRGREAFEGLDCWVSDNAGLVQQTAELSLIDPGSSLQVCQAQPLFITSCSQV